MKYLVSVVIASMFAVGCKFVKAGSVPSGDHKVETTISSQTENSYEGVEKPVGGPRGKELHHVGYVSSFNAMTMQPNWVAWELLASEVGGATERLKIFLPDPQLPQSMQVVHSDYTNSGYDRGHMCPAADMKWSADAMRECFFMTNICPQSPKLNQHYWERLEAACRRWAEAEGRVYICCGPVFRDFKTSLRIGNAHKVCVPDGFFKVVLCITKGAERTLAFYYDNNDERQTMEDALRSVDEIEQLTGMDFFSALPDDLETRIESQRGNLSEWN